MRAAVGWLSVLATLVGAHALMQRFHQVDHVGRPALLGSFDLFALLLLLEQFLEASS
jgi:hypothetical protein